MPSGASSSTCTNLAMVATSPGHHSTLKRLGRPKTELGSQGPGPAPWLGTGTAQAGPRGDQGPGQSMRGHWYGQSHFAVTHRAASSSMAKPITGRVTTGNSDAFMAVLISYWHTDRLFMQICAQHSHNKAHFQAFWFEWGNPWSHQGPEDEGSVLGEAGTLPHPEGSQGVPLTPHGLLLPPPLPCYLPLFSLQKLGDFFFLKKGGGGVGYKGEN